MALINQHLHHEKNKVAQNFANSVSDLFRWFKNLKSHVIMRLRLMIIYVKKSLIITRYGGKQPNKTKNQQQTLTKIFLFQYLSFFVISHSSMIGKYSSKIKLIYSHSMHSPKFEVFSTFSCVFCSIFFESWVVVRCRIYLNIIEQFWFVNDRMNRIRHCFKSSHSHLLCQ